MKIEWLFLDIDGVLHPVDCGAATFSRHTLLRSIVERSTMKICISSAWRMDYDLEALRTLIFEGEPALQARIVATTPIFADFPPSYLMGFRLREIQAFCVAQQYDGGWIALDDKASIFFRQPGDQERHATMNRHLLLCDGEIGLTREIADRAVALANDAIEAS